MLLFGILFIMIGLIFILSEIYIAKREKDGILIQRTKLDMKKWLTRYKILMGILSIALGLFSILNHIIY